MTPGQERAANGHSGSGLTYIPREIGSRLAKATARVCELETLLHTKNSHLASLDANLRHHLEILAEKQEELQKIHGSHGWKFLKIYYRARNLLFPPGSVRRGIAARLMKGVDLLKEFVKKSSPPSGPCPQAPSVNVPGVSRLEKPLLLGSTQEPYARWIEANEPDADELARQRDAVFAYRPRFSLLVAPLREPSPYLARLLESIRLQTYGDWEVCFTAGESALSWLTSAIKASGLDATRCKVIGRSAHESWGESANAALAASTGDYLTVVSPEDLLPPFALFEIARAINRQADADFLYSDEDCLEDSGDARVDPLFKPDWSPDTLRGHNYIGDLAVIARSLMEQIGGFHDGFDGAASYDLVLRASDRARAIVHVPHVLYHRRARIYASDSNRVADAEGDRRALRGHLERLGTCGEVDNGLRPGTYRVSYFAPTEPLISLIIPTKDHADMLARCLESIQQSTYRRREILVVENGSTDPATFAYYRTLEREANVKVIAWEKPFNYSAINNFGVSHAAGEVLLFLNNDMQVINPDWLERMLEHALRPQMGAVGAMLYYPDETIQHAGMVLLKDKGPVHVHRFAPNTSAGHGNRLVTAQNVSAVTGACLMTRRDIYSEVGGFDESFAMLYNDVDLCLKMRQKGYLVVWTPFARLYHFESVSRGYDGWLESEGPRFRQKWGDLLQAGDPYFSPHLDSEGPDCRVRA